MALTNEQLDALAVELGKPEFAEMVGRRDDTGPAAVLNAPRTDIRINRGAITGADVLAQLQAADVMNLAQAQTQALGLFVINGGDTDLDSYDTLAAAMPAATAAALAAFKTRPGSRAEALFGRGVALSNQDIARARGRMNNG